MPPMPTGFPAGPGTVTAGGPVAELRTQARGSLASIVGAMEDDRQPIPDGFDGPPDAAPAYDTADDVRPHAVLVPVDVSDGRCAST